MGAATYRCPGCQSEVPAMYVVDYAKFPPVVGAAIGNTGHGKTAYFASLMHELRGERLASVWKRFHTLALDDSSLVEVLDNMNRLREGIDTEASPKNFERPTLIRISGVPLLGNATLCMYDVSGEAFYLGAEIERYAKYVRRARAVLLLVSIPNLAPHGSTAGEALLQQLNAYVLGMQNHFQASTKDKHLVVVYTKADQIQTSHLERWPSLQKYLRADPLEDLAKPQIYIDKLYRVSRELRDFTRQELGAHLFLNAADEYFASVDFTLVSALGSQPEEGRLRTRVAPRRVLDPLLIVLQKGRLQSAGSSSGGGKVPHKRIVCPKCEQSLRVPDRAKKLQVTCPSCRHQFTNHPDELDRGGSTGGHQERGTGDSEFQWTPAHTHAAMGAGAALFLLMLLYSCSGRDSAPEAPPPEAAMLLDDSAAPIETAAGEGATSRRQPSTRVPSPPLDEGSGQVRDRTSVRAPSTGLERGGYDDMVAESADRERSAADRPFMADEPRTTRRGRQVARGPRSEGVILGGDAYRNVSEGARFQVALGRRDGLQTGDELTVVCRQHPIVDPRDPDKILGYEECSLRVVDVREEESDAELTAHETAVPAQGDRVIPTEEESMMANVPPLEPSRGPTSQSRVAPYNQGGPAGYGDYDYDSPDSRDEMLSPGARPQPRESDGYDGFYDRVGGSQERGGAGVAPSRPTRPPRGRL